MNENIYVSDESSVQQKYLKIQLVFHFIIYLVKLMKLQNKKIIKNISNKIQSKELIELG